MNQDCVENLFSIIRGKGGFRDNPDPQQFRAAFRHLVIDKLMVLSNSANCQLDADKILLDISNITVLKKRPRNVSVPQHIAGTEIISMAVPAPSIAKQNVVAYMSGYLLRKYPIDKCVTCQNSLKISQLPESSSVSHYELLRNKAYKESGCLVYPSEDFSNFVQQIESLFSAIFGGIMHTKGVLQTLCKGNDEEIKKFYQCGNAVCLERIHQYVKLYMTVRIHHTLKTCNIGHTHGHERNRKMLKLCHE